MTHSPRITNRQALRTALEDATRLCAPVRQTALDRARELTDHLAEPIEVLVIGPHETALDTMHFLAGLDDPLPRDLSALVACLRLAHGDSPGMEVLGGDGTRMEMPDEPIMLAPHAPVTVTIHAPRPILREMQLSHLRNLAAGAEDPVRAARIARADAVLWISDAGEDWTEAEEALYLALPARQVDNALLLLTDADRVTDDPALLERFNAKVRRLNERFVAIRPIALPAALQAAPGGALTDVEMFTASGAHAVLHAVRALLDQARAQKDDEADRLLRTLSSALDEARAQSRPAPEAPAPEARPQAMAAAPAFPRPDETALTILREEAELEAQARRAEAAGQAAPAPAAPPAPAPDAEDPVEDDSLAAFLRSCALAHHARDFDRADTIQRREAFDAMLDLVTGLARRLEEAPEGIAQADRLLEDLEEAEDMLMLLSCEADDDALTDAADIVTQLIGDLFDRKSGSPSDQCPIVAQLSPSLQPKMAPFELSANPRDSGETQ